MLAIEAIQTRRSIRRYTPVPVPRELLARIVAAAHHAPSNWNRQPWKFLVADDPEWCQWIVSTIQQSIDCAEAADVEQELFHFIDHTRAFSQPLDEGAVLILAFWKPSPERVERRIGEILGSGDIGTWNPNLLSLGMALQNLLLAAHAEGLGACMHSGPVPFLRGRINAALRLPPNLQLAGLVSLGWPAETPDIPPRRPMDRVVQWLDGPTPQEVA